MTDMIRSLLKRCELIEEDFDETRVQPLIDSMKADLLAMLKKFYSEDGKTDPERTR